MHLAPRAQTLSGSATLELGARVAELRAAGVDVISLGAGEPDFPTPPEAIAAATDFIAKGQVHYTHPNGLPELRAAAAGSLSRSTGVGWTAEQLVVTCGAKEGVALAILAAAGAGDEVLVPTPGWISYEPMVAIADARVVRLPCAEDAQWKLRPETLAGALTPRSRVLVLNTPNNPTGSVYTEAELAALGRVLEGRELLVVSDEIYSPFVYEGRHVSPASIPGLAGRTVVVNGVSKSHAMTGWRIGFLAGPRPVVEAVGRLKSHLSSNAAAPSQHAALGALRGGEGWSRRMAEAFARRRKLAVEALRRVPGVSVQLPAGAFYVFPRVDALYGGRARGSAELCRLLLDEARVAVVAGADFAEDRCLRL
ncbi:MAG TPA: pyridoxal phosphate-dependent aminotransferase, partial [Planctomycetota bacterium]|nr:pyridoxal phosphate-dependent aminotransferase [Planctomycetota bacterium]